MSFRSYIAFGLVLGVGQILVGESLAQYNQPAYQYPQHQQQPMMNGPAVGPAVGPTAGPGMYQASARMRQDQAMQPRAPMVQGQAIAAPQNGFAAPPQLAPSMVAPSCGSDYVGLDSCGCSGDQHHGYGGGYDAYSGGSEVGQDYFGCDAGGCGANSGCGCSDRYLKVFGGWNWLQDFEVGIQDPGDARINFNDGWAIGGAVGKYMTQNARRELEFTYRNNTTDSISIGAGAAAIDGFVNCYSLMGNLVYELKRLQMAGFNPFIGGGVGVAYVDGEFVGGGSTIDDTAFAYQAFAGVDRQLTANAKLFVEYRYFATSEVEIDSLIPSTNEYEANNLFFGLQFRR